MKNVIAIFGVPRSGTSWLGQIFNSSPNTAYRFQPLFSYAFKGAITKASSRRDIVAFHQNLLDTEDPFVLQKTNISGNPGVTFNKEVITHMVWKEVRYLHLINHLLKNSNTKVIGLLRHPCAVINSWIRAPKEFDSEWDVKEEWRHGEKKNGGRLEEFYGFEGWKEAVEIFEKGIENFPERFILVRYEDLLANPIQTSKDLFGFADLPFNDQVKSFIFDSTTKHSNDLYGIFKVKTMVGLWEGNLDKNISEEILRDPVTKNYYNE